MCANKWLLNCHCCIATFLTVCVKKKKKKKKKKKILNSKKKKKSSGLFENVINKMCYKSYIFDIYVLSGFGIK